MRVLNLMFGRERGGLESMALQYHHALRGRGHAVLNLAREGGWFAGQLADEPDAIRSVSSPGPFSPRIAREITRVAATFEADLIIAHGNRAIGLATSVFGGARPPIVAVVHNFRFESSLRRARLALCVSRPVQAAVQARYARLETALMENFTLLSPGPLERAPQETPLIGAVGRLHINKGFDILVRAAAILRDQGRPFRLEIAGDGPERPSLEAEIARLDLGDRIELKGWLEDVDKFLDGLSLFVSSARAEPFGLVVIEAMARGTPVVATAIDGPADILQRGILGRMALPEDPESLAQAIATALVADGESRRMAALAQAEALSRYGLAGGGIRLEAALTPIIKYTTVQHP